MRGSLIVAVLLTGCAAPDPGATRIIGHGGMGSEGEYPMNSAESLRAALAIGTDGIELDAQLTSDGVLVAYHAADLAELTACTGKVNSMTWDQINACPVMHDGMAFKIARVDSLLIELGKQYPEADFTLDCKLFALDDWWAYLQALSDAVIALDYDSVLTNRILIDCQTDDFLRLICMKKPGFKAFLYVTEMKGAAERALSLGCAGITIAHGEISGDEISDAHRLGLRVALFGTEGALAHRKAFSKKPDRLQTDCPEYAVALRASRN
jgi:glycerophosphoryl diester phosphodiesterase